MTLLPILLALGMHPQLTAVSPSCFLQDHPPGVPCHDIKIVSAQAILTPEQQAAYPENAWIKPCGPQNHDDWCVAPEKAAAPDPGCTCPVAQVCRGTSDGDGIPHTKEACEAGGGAWDAVWIDSGLTYNGTSLPPAHPKPKRKAKPVEFTSAGNLDDFARWCKVQHLPCYVTQAWLGTGTAPRAFYYDKSPEGIGDSKQSDPATKADMKTLATQLMWTNFGAGACFLVVVLLFVTLLGRFRADIRNAILGTGRKS